MPDLPNGLPEGQQLFHPLAEMALLIALRIRPENGEPMRTTIDKVRKRLVYATENGDLQVADAGLYFVPQVIAWSQKKWPGKFDDLPAEHSRAATATLVMRDQARAFVIPGDLPGCQEALEDAHRKNRQLQTELNAAHAEIERLEPIAYKYEQIRQKNTRSAKLPRKGDL
jgi:hypothetical protein